MDNENEIIETEVVEKETIDPEVVDEEEIIDEEESPMGFDPNAVLGAIMQSQDAELRNVVAKLSGSNAMTKVAVVCLLFKILNYVGIVALLYSLYCCIYVLLHYNKVKEHEHMIKDLMSKNGNSINIKKTVIKNLIILILCIPLAVLSFWYWYTFTAS